MFLLAFKETSEPCFADHWAYTLAVGIAKHCLMCVRIRETRKGRIGKVR